MLAGELGERPEAWDPRWEFCRRSIGDIRSSGAGRAVIVVGESPMPRQELAETSACQDIQDRWRERERFPAGGVRSFDGGRGVNALMRRGTTDDSGTGRGTLRAWPWNSDRQTDRLAAGLRQTIHGPQTDQALGPNRPAVELAQTGRGLRRPSRRRRLWPAHGSEHAAAPGESVVTAAPLSPAVGTLEPRENGHGSGSAGRGITVECRALLPIGWPARLMALPSFLVRGRQSARTRPVTVFLVIRS